jgi:ribosome-binding ATPase YchF (GTP1/OBG family)
MYNPRKRVPATIEFADIAATSTGAAQALLDVAAYRNADALVHVVRAFRDEAVPHVAGGVDPARDVQAMEDELILADLGIAERRLERLEKDLRKTKSADLERERDLMIRCKAALEDGSPLRALGLAGDDIKRLRGFQMLSAKPLLIVINLDEADASSASDTAGAAARAGLSERLSRAGSPVRYVPVAEEAARQSLAQRMPAWRVEPTLEFNREVSGGLYDVVTGDVELVTGRPPRSFDDFVVDLAAAA